MFGLSRTAWNNVIIFGVLALFLLFYIAPNQLAKIRDEQAQTLIPAHATIVHMRFPAAVLERSGPQWRFKPELGIALDISKLLTTWQQQPLRPEPVMPNAIFASVCQVELLYSGEPKWQQWQIVSDQSHWYLQQDEQIFKIHPHEAIDLCPLVLRR